MVDNVCLHQARSEAVSKELQHKSAAQGEELKEQDLQEQLDKLSVDPT